MKIFNSIKIFPKILFACLLITVIPFVGLFYQISLSEESQKEELNQRLFKSSEIIGGQVNSWLDNNIQILKLVASYEPFVNQDVENQKSILVNTKNNLDWVTLIFSLDTEGNALARSDANQLINYSDRKYFKEAIQSKELGQQVLIGKKVKIPLLCLAVPIKREAQDVVGAVTQCMSLLSISDEVTSFRVGNTGFSFLVDERQRLIAHGDKKAALVGDLQDFSFHPALSKTENTIHTDYFEGKERVFLTTSVGSGWKLVIQQDFEEAFGSHLETKTKTFWFLIVTILVAILLAFIISYTFSSPIKKLTKIADAYSRGVFVENVIDQKRNDEVGDLAKAISRMSKTIQLALVRLKKAKLKKG